MGTLQKDTEASLKKIPLTKLEQIEHQISDNNEK